MDTLCPLFVSEIFLKSVWEQVNLQKALNFFVQVVCVYLAWFDLYQNI